jgi:alkylated DNA repair protein (DNA oxidative demethylase)
MAGSARARGGLALDEASFPAGFHYLPGYFDDDAQLAIANEVRELLAAAPLFTQTMPKTGAPLSVRMSNAGEFGWVTDREGGYRYQRTHPASGKSWFVALTSYGSIFRRDR